MTNPYISENIIYVAGDRVITDPLCKPFSMGRNLLCVYSKKHMNDVPELADMKRRANTRSLKEMAFSFEGWVKNNMDCTKWWQGQTGSDHKPMVSANISVQLELLSSQSVRDPTNKIGLEELRISGRIRHLWA